MDNILHNILDNSHNNIDNNIDNSLDNSLDNLKEDIETLVSEFIEIIPNSTENISDNKIFDDFILIVPEKSHNNSTYNVVKYLTKYIFWNVILSSFGRKLICLTSIYLAGENIVSILGLSPVVVFSTLLWII